MSLYSRFRQSSGGAYYLIRIEPAIAPIIVQTTSQFHHLVSVSILSISKNILNDPASLDTGDYVFDHYPNPGNQPIFVPLGPGERPTPRFFLGLVNRYFRQSLPLKAAISV